MSRRLMPSTATIALHLVMLTSGCWSHTNKSVPEHYSFPSHKPVNFPAAVDRLQQVHQELVKGPLVARKVHAVHHDHDHHHGHHHSHDHAHHHVHLDALQEISDIVRWLPELAADSDLSEESWNRVYATAKSLEVILADASARSGDERGETYVQYQTEVDRHLGQLLEIQSEFPKMQNSLAGDQQD